jgi:predicted RNA-binding protein with PUA-like domain
MAYWLMKSEPSSYSWDDLVRDGGTEWDGVRNNAARLHLKAMKAGDEAFFYHSMADKAVVGIMRVTRSAEPDPKAPEWVRVRVEPVRPLARPVTLAEIKAEPALAKMELIRQSRLSVAPVRDEEWRTVLELAKERAKAGQPRRFDANPVRLLRACARCACARAGRETASVSVSPWA